MNTKTPVLPPYGGQSTRGRLRCYTGLEDPWQVVFPFLV